MLWNLCLPPLCCSLLTINCNSKTSSEVHLLPADLRLPHSSQLSMAAAGSVASAPAAEPRLVQARQPGLEYFLEHNSGQLYLLSNARGALDYAVYRWAARWQGIALSQSRCRGCHNQQPSADVQA